MPVYYPIWVKLYICAVVFLLGTVMGSALNCLAYRIVHDQKWSGGRSRCPHCGHILGVLDLIPVASFLMLKGKCRYCGEKLAKRYVLAEAFLGACYVTLRWGLALPLMRCPRLCCAPACLL